AAPAWPGSSWRVPVHVQCTLLATQHRLPHACQSPRRGSPGHAVHVARGRLPAHRHRRWRRVRKSQSHYSKAPTPLTTELELWSSGETYSRWSLFGVLLEYLE